MPGSEQQEMNEKDLQGQYAGFVSRFLAWLIDRGVVVAVIAVTIWLISLVLGIFGIDINNCSAYTSFSSFVCYAGLAFILGFSLIFAPLYTIFLWTLAGQTIGKAVLGIRVVRSNGERMTFRVSVRRYVGYILSFLAFGLGFLLILVDDERRGFDDRFASTYVVYSWSARQNERIIEHMTKRFFKHRRQLDEMTQKLNEKTSTLKEQVSSTREKDSHIDTESESSRESEKAD